MGCFLTPDTAITLSGIAVRFGGYTAVEHVDLNVRPGEFVGLVGPTGCGKSTLLNVITGLLLRHVYLPSAAQWILSSLRASIGFAVTGAVVGEYPGSSAGIGHVIAQAEGSFDAVGVFAGLALLGAFVLCLDGVISLVENRVIVWRPKTEEKS